MTETQRSLDDALDTLASADTLLVALDFDGTLAPFVDRPEDARALPEADAAIERLIALANTHVAYVSGRAVESLREVTRNHSELLLVGSHGAEFFLGGAEVQPPLQPAERELLERLVVNLSNLVATYPLAAIELKPAGLALHSRRLSAAETLALTEAALVIAVPEGDDQSGITVRDGKDVLEFSVVAATKGDGVLRVKNYTQSTTVLYAGDDVTDEDAFAVLSPGDVAIKSGEGATIAPYRVSGPAEMAEFLTRLAARREASLSR